MRVDLRLLLIGCLVTLLAVAMWRNREDFAKANNHMREDCGARSCSIG